MTFQLKGIDPVYPYLTKRGISRELAEKFGVGYFPGKGSVHGRVVIPIHNERGDLVVYAGLSIDDSEPKYKLPSEFQKSLELYNLHRVIGKEGTDRLVEAGRSVTEDFLLRLGHRLWARAVMLSEGQQPDQFSAE